MPVVRGVAQRQADALSRQPAAAHAEAVTAMPKTPIAGRGASWAEEPA